ncbi:MAG: methionine--tRNA ligase, partial [Alphaproteobacteria bacterium]|nr:methionine--tRNA ligase [Alphaproteobacteria bacterium]
MKKFYITTPIYYVNDVPHIGHAYTTLLADIIARFMRLSSSRVKFLTGTDEHGQKIVKAAKEKNTKVENFVDEKSKSFRDLCYIMNISNDDFIRTTEDRHKKAAAALWEKLEQNGHIYKGKYSGWYSVRDEAYYSAEELLESGLAPTGAPVEWMEEESYFFNLSQWQEKLLEYYENNTEFIKPSSKRNEVISFVKGGLHDLSISRMSLAWGIEVPKDSAHVIYVWLDALTNYLSALGFPEKTQDMNDFWPADIHMIGKDILKFHAIYWPAFLMASGIDLPKTIFAHGWWTNEGQKISKSLGNVIDPIQIIDQYGLDYFRYYLAREVIIGNDGNFSHETFRNRINSELANKIGNLCQRTIAFINKNLNSTLNCDKEFLDLFQEEYLCSLAYEYAIKISSHMKNLEISQSMDLIVKLAEEANIFIDKEAPWNLKKTNEERMNQVLAILCETIRMLGIFLLPFIPDSANKILDLLGIVPAERSFIHANIEFALKNNATLAEAYPIFKRIVPVQTPGCR